MGGRGQHIPWGCRGGVQLGDLAAAGSCLVCTLHISEVKKGPFFALDVGKKKKLNILAVWQEGPKWASFSYFPLPAAPLV